MKNYTLLLAGITILGISACKKETEFVYEPDCPEDRIYHQNDIADNFAINTYWIYYDSITNSTDSVWVESTGFYQTTFSCENNFHPSFTVRSSESNDTVLYYMINQSFMGYLPYDGPVHEGTTVREDWMLGHFTPTYSALDPMHINGRNYNVQQHNILSPDPCEFDIRYRYTTDPDFGPVRIDQYDNGEVISKKYLIRSSLF